MAALKPSKMGSGACQFCTGTHFRSQMRYSWASTRPAVSRSSSPEKEMWKGHRHPQHPTSSGLLALWLSKRFAFCFEPFFDFSWALEEHKCGQVLNLRWCCSNFPVGLLSMPHIAAHSTAEGRICDPEEVQAMVEANALTYWQGRSLGWTDPSWGLGWNRRMTKNRQLHATALYYIIIRQL